MADWQAYFKKSSIVAVFYLILANNTPSATAADDFPVMKFNLLQTRKRCKRPSAKRAPGIKTSRCPGSFKYHGFLEHAIRQTFPPVKRSNQCFGLRINICIVIHLEIRAVGPEVPGENCHITHQFEKPFFLTISWQKIRF